MIIQKEIYYVIFWYKNNIIIEGEDKESVSGKNDGTCKIIKNNISSNYINGMWLWKEKLEE